MIEIYRLQVNDSDEEEFVLQATYNDDQTVDGDTYLARSIRNTIDNWSRDVSQDHERIEEVLMYRYNTGVFSAVQS